MSQELHVWIPSNRTYGDGRPKAMDGLNEIIDSNRADRHMGARIERENVEWCAFFIIRAMRRQKWAPMRTKDTATPAKVYITFVEANRKRDVPNIYGGGLKYALDALTRIQGGKFGSAAIYDDSVAWLKECVPSIRVDKKKPGIEITVIREDQ